MGLLSAGSLSWGSALSCETRGGVQDKIFFSFYEKKKFNNNTSWNKSLLPCEVKMYLYFPLLLTLRPLVVSTEHHLCPSVSSTTCQGCLNDSHGRLRQNMFLQITSWGWRQRRVSTGCCSHVHDSCRSWVWAFTFIFIFIFTLTHTHTHPGLFSPLEG